MQTLLEQAARIGRILKSRGETVAVAESSTGGLVSAALLATPGASAFFRGGAVVYTREARSALLRIDDRAMHGFQSATEPYAALIARTVRESHRADWGLGESGAAGPTGNRYGDRAGHVCLAIDGKSVSQMTIETGDDDRIANMRTFAAALLNAFEQALE